MTDALQGVVMLAGLILLFGTILSQGTLSDLMAKASVSSPEILSPHGVNNYLGWPMMLSFWILICFGTMGLPHTLVRLFAVKDRHSLKRGMVWGTVICFLMTLLPHLCGVLGRALYPELTIPDDIMPKLISGLFSPFWAGVLLAAPIAAVMSSVDSMLLQSAVSLVRDGAVKLYPSLNASQQIRLTRVAMLLITVVATYWAMKPPEMIVWINLAAFGALQAVFLWPIIAGVFWPNIKGHSAFLAMFSGLISYLGLQLNAPLMWHVHPIVPALALSLLVMLLSHVIVIQMNSKVLNSLE